MALPNALSRTVVVSAACLFALIATASPAQALDRVRFELNRGFFVVDLFGDTPQANANFLNYLNTGRYDNSFFHRKATSNPLDPPPLGAGVDVIQGGGFFLDGSTVNAITTDAPINDDSEATHTNAQYTIAMAENNLGYTSQWFVNTLANPVLDGDFTVFGDVTVGRDRIDEIFAADVADLFSGSDPLDATPFENLNGDQFVQVDELIIVNFMYWIGDNDLDGDLDSADIDELFANFGSDNALFDNAVDGGNAGQTDVDALVRDLFETEYGDANLDGQVGLLDLDALGVNFNQPGGWAEGDFTGDGQVGLLDLDRIGTTFGFGVPTAPASPPVPEPATIGLIGLAGLALLRRRR